MRRPVSSLWNRLSLPAKVGLPLVAITLVIALGAGAVGMLLVREELGSRPSTAEAQHAALTRLGGRVVGVASAAVAIEIAALAGLLYVLVHRRVRRLTEAAARMASGDMTVQIGEGGGEPTADGLTRLARAFDEMAATVEARTRELQDAEIRYRFLVEEIPAATYVWSVKQGRTIYASPQVEPMLGYTVEETMRDPTLWSRLLHPDDRARMEAIFDRAESTGEHVDEEYRLVARDGSVKWIHERAVVASDRATGERLLQGVMYDVTERRAMEDALGESEARKSAVMESALDCVISIDHLGRITDFNPAAERTFGYRRGEVLGRPMAEVIIPASLRERHRQGFARLLRTGEPMILGQRLQLTGMRADGSEFPVEVAITRVDAPGPPSFTGYLRDITERVRAEQELRDSVELLRQSTRQRQLLLARLQDAQERERQRIAEDIHDDSLQVMTALGLRLDAMCMSATNEQHREELERMADTVRQCIRRLRHLLFELRPTALDRHGLAAALHLHLEEMASENGLQVDLENRLVEEPSEAVRTALYRIAQEALTNVRKHSQARRVEILLEPREGGVFVRVRDDGRGFAAPVEGNSGPGHLGLSAMRERAEMADGWCRVASVPDSGTTVEFWIPSSRKAAAAPA